MFFMNETRAVIFANGNLPDPRAARGLIQSDDFLIGADGGTRHVLSLGMQPGLIVGDMDSLDEKLRREFETAGVRLDIYPEDKDFTDLELALKHAVEAGYTHILIMGGLGGRFDQMLGNLSLLADPTLEQVDIRMDDGVEEVFFMRKQAVIPGRAGDIVSLLPWGGPVSGVITQGLRWPLQNEVLFSYKTRGVSNEMTADQASIRIHSGLLLCVHRRTTDR
jgi:thiamine pyrophosphokinase